MEKDPAELNNLMLSGTQDQRKYIPYKAKEDLLDGRLKELYVESMKSTHPTAALRIAVEKYFGSFVEEEYAKGYRKPQYPSEIFKKMFERYRHIDFAQFINFWKHIGIIGENEAKFGWPNC